MYIKIQTSEKANGNKNSCAALATYLEKEDMEQENKSLNNQELPEEKKGFFSHNSDKISKDEVINEIDTNKRALGKDDAKFYSVTLAPTNEEQQHLLNDIVDKKIISSVKDLSSEEKRLFEDKLKQYSRKTMDEYAKNFKRDGLDSGDQLLYFGKVEHNRYFKGTDIEVKNGEAKSGTIKPGLNSHVHIIVSRKDKEQRLKLSPLANEKAGKSNSKLNGKRVQRGFDRVAFKNSGEKIFDNMFDYKRKHEEKVQTMIDNKKTQNNLSTGKIENLKDYKKTNDKKIMTVKQSKINDILDDLPPNQKRIILNNYNNVSEERKDVFIERQKRFRIGRDYKKEIDKVMALRSPQQEFELYPVENELNAVNYEEFENSWNKEWNDKYPIEKPIEKKIDFEI